EEVTPVDPPELSAVETWLHPDFPTLVYAGWTQSTAATVRVEYAFDPGDWRSSPPRELEAGAHEEVMLGVPYGTPVTWRIVAEGDGGIATTDDAVATTGDSPPIPTVALSVEDESRIDPDADWFYLSVTSDDFGDPWWVMLVDRQGRPVWSTQSDPQRMSLHPRVSADGTALLVDQNNYWSMFFDVGAQGTVDKIRLDGTPVHTWATPGLHHDYTELPDGTLAWGGWDEDYEESLQLVHLDGESEVLWACRPWLDTLGVGDDCLSNTVNYREDTDTFLFSFFTIDTIVEVDHATGAALRWFGHVPGAWAFDPPESAFWYQHGGHVTPEGTLLLSAHSQWFSTEIVVREYEFDEPAQVLHEVFSFGVGDGVSGSDMGESHRLGNGNTLHNAGTNPLLREITPEGEVVWQLSWDTETLGRSTPVPDLYALMPDRP
ncbi:MAG: hypothetical protein ABMA64_19855, partial [Myxococcota bacterium]